jgi:hypothetical protein
VRAKHAFRLLIVLSWLVPVLSLAILQLPYSQTSADLERSRRSEEVFRQVRSQALPDDVVWQVAPILLTLALIVSVPIGLWFFHRWARLMYIPATLLYAFYLPLGTPYVPTGAGRVAEWLGYGLSGAVAAMAFLPPVAGLFAKREV